MPQTQGQYQVQSEAQLQKLSPLQLMTTRLLELPIVELEQRVKDEAIDNVALDVSRVSSADDADDEFFNKDWESYTNRHEERNQLTLGL